MKKLLALLVLLLAVRSAYGQVSVALAPVPSQQFFSSTGAPLSSGCIYTYITNTSTPLATYTDGTGSATNTNPVVLDIGGFGNIWLSNSSYRFTIYAKGLGGVIGSDCFSGAFQRTVDNVSAYTIINQANNIFLLGAISDPAGSAGELAYRSDIPCIRAFLSTWDCLVTLSATQTLTNKTLVNPIISSSTGAVLTSAVLNNPNVNGTIVTGPPATYLVMTNDLTTGTSLNHLVKINPAGLAGFAIISSGGDTGGALGIAVAGAGVSGNVTIQQSGSASCVFDNATTPGNYVTIGVSVAGDCHDAGATYPTNQQVIGRSLALNAVAGTDILDLFPPEIKPSISYPQVTYNTVPPASNANIGTTGMSVSPSSGATYRFTVYGSVTVVGAACTSATTVSVSVLWQDPNEAGNASSVFFVLVPSGGNNGNLGRMVLQADPGAFPLAYTGTFRVKGTTQPSYFTTYTAGATCAPAPVVQIYPILEQLTAN